MNTHFVATLADLSYGFVCTLLLCWILLPTLIWLSPVLGLVDQPNDRKVHSQSIPAVGGLAMGLALIGVSVLYSRKREAILKYL